MVEESFIYKPNKNVEDVAVQAVQEYYTILGSHEYLDENENPRISDESNCLAKKLSTENGSFKYMIKINKENRIYNPLGMYSEGKHKKFLAKIGKDEFTFRRVNMDIFNYYVNFLRTRNDAWLKNAERSLI